MSVIFQKDWKDERGNLRSIPHANTKNTSFLRTAQLLKRMGISNYAFMLCLYDPDLKNIDPFDLEEDTPENERLRTKVQIEARRNVWYYLRECVRIYAQGGDPVRFRLDRASAAMTWCFSNGLDYCGMAPRQTGKEQPLNSLIQTSDGWCRMGDITLNHKAVLPNGGLANIVGIYPQGKKDIYRVYFEDDRWTECGEDHLWKVYNYYWKPEETRWRIMTLKEIITWKENNPKTDMGICVPLIQPEIKDDVTLPIDPYVLGILLGDGSLSENCIDLATQDQFIVDELSRLLPDSVEIVHRARYNYGIVKTARNRGPGVNEHSELHKALRELGLIGTRSDTKFIPDLYLTASPAQKLSLLQGLMDTDGTVSGANKRNNCTPVFCTTSLQMAQQLKIIVRSLGGICKLRETKPHYYYKDEKKFGKPAYRLYIRLDNPRSCFRLSRKSNKLSETYKSAGKMRLKIKDIEYVGQHEAQCIEVDDPEHLYITDDYIVTHNTVCALSLTSWIMYSSGYEFVIGMFCKDNKLREENVKRVRSFGDSLPKWWLAEDKFKDKKNTTEIFYHALRTHYSTMVAQKDKKTADLQARGASMPMLHIDELEYCSSLDISYSTMLSSTDAARANAKINGKPHSNIITTTAGDPTKAECKAAMEILRGAMPFTELLYDLPNTEELHKVVEATSPQKMILGVFSHLQLGYDNAWLKDKITRNRLSRDQVMRDYLNRRVSIAETPIIPAATLALINSSQREPIWLQPLKSGFVIYWYVDEATVKSQAFKDRPIVVGCDSSEMIGRDATTLVGVDPRSLETVCSFRCSEGNINVVGVMIHQLLLMFPKWVWVPENKSSGTSLIDIVAMMLRREGHNPFFRIFNWVINNSHEEEFGKINVRDTSLLDTAVKRYFGIKTDKSKRDELYSTTLLEAANKASSRIKDQILIQELSSLTVRNGRVDHAVGGHDDTVVAWLMAMWFILSGKHLDRYGIKPGTVLSHINPGQTDKSRLAADRQVAIRDKIEELEQAVRTQTDPVRKRLLAADVTLLRSMVENGTVPTPSTADDLIRDSRKYTDRETAEQSRTAVDIAEVERSLRMMLQLN